MPRTSRRDFLAVCVCATLVLGGFLHSPVAGLARADELPPRAARHPIARRDLAGDRRVRGATSASGGWWLGTAGIALVLIALGAKSLASKRWPPGSRRDAGPLEVVGRTALSARHSVYLLRAGARILIVGAGSQGPPASLGELTDPDEIERILRGRGREPAEPGEFGPRIGAAS